jgi:DNA-binding XRE family transcriptional regulator
MTTERPRQSLDVDSKQLLGLDEWLISRTVLNVAEWIDANGPVTKRQLRSLFGAALYVEIKQQMFKRHKRITQQQIADLIHVTRKTIRAWGNRYRVRS